MLSPVKLQDKDSYHFYTIFSPDLSEVYTGYGLNSQLKSEPRCQCQCQWRGTRILSVDMTFSKKLPQVSNGFEI
jgi:hypothetical protein